MIYMLFQDVPVLLEEDEILEQSRIPFASGKT